MGLGMSAERGKARSSEQAVKSVTGLEKSTVKTDRVKGKIARGHARSKQWAAELSTRRMLLEQATVILVQQQLLVAAIARSKTAWPVYRPKLKIGKRKQSI